MTRRDLIERNPLALEANAASARLALACSSLSSDEYQAELIAARRQAGVYGPRRPALAWFALAVTAVAAVFIVAF